VAGDRIASVLPNMPETIIAMLASASIGAVFSTCSPDFGVRGVVDRFGQIAPKVLFAADGYYYNGKTLDSVERLGAIVAELPFGPKGSGHSVCERAARPDARSKRAAAFRFPCASRQ